MGHLLLALETAEVHSDHRCLPAQQAELQELNLALTDHTARLLAGRLWLVPGPGLSALPVDACLWCLQASTSAGGASIVVLQCHHHFKLHVLNFSAALNQTACFQLIYHALLRIGTPLLLLFPQGRYMLDAVQHMLEMLAAAASQSCSTSCSLADLVIH